MKRVWIHGVAVIAVIALLFTPSWGNENGNDEEVKMAVEAKISIEQAIKTATEKVTGKAIKAYVEEEHDTIIWEVYIVTPDGKLMEVHIDAAEGNVIDVEEEEEEGKEEKENDEKD